MNISTAIELAKDIYNAGIYSDAFQNLSESQQEFYESIHEKLADFCDDAACEGIDYSAVINKEVFFTY